MYLEGPAVPLSGTGKTTLIPALVSAVLCIVFIRFGLFTLFFLVPLGVCALLYSPVTAWFGFILAILGNAIVTAGLALHYGTGLGNAGLDALYFALLALGFTWMMADSPRYVRQLIPAVPHIRTAFRFIAASAAGALAFLGMIFAIGSDEGFSISIVDRSQIEVLSAAYISSFGADAAQQAFLERLLTPDRVIATLTSIVLRGGAMFSAFFLLFFSRQAAFVLTRLFRRQQGRPGSSDLIGFHVPRGTIWVLSLCLPVIVAGRIGSLPVIEIPAWNVLIICAIMFLAQGGGIVLFNLARRPMPVMMRLLCSLLFVFLVFSPGINVLAVGVLILLGITENWLPMRVVKKETTPL